MDDGFGLGTLFLVEEPLTDSDGKTPEPGFTRRSAKKAKSWVRDLKAKGKARREEKKAEKEIKKAEKKKQKAEARLQATIEKLGEAMEDPRVLAELTDSEQARADLIGEIMGELHRDQKRKEVYDAEFGEGAFEAKMEGENNEE
jgi:hypothetical protein